MDDHLVHAHSVSVTLNGRSILQDVSFNIPRKSVTAIIGPNGSGKTTLVKAMLGLIPFEGAISFNKPNGIGYVPQKFEYDRSIPMTIEEFLDLFNKNNTPANTIEEKLAEVGLEQKRKLQIGTLSGGEMQRLLIAKALLNDPELLFLDEPASGIDIEGEKSFYQLIHHLNKHHNTTVVMVSHEVEMITRFATNVLCLSKSLICSGPPKSALTKDTLEQLFGKDTSIHSH